MKEGQTTLEVIAPSIDEAVEKGLDDLGLPREAVEIEILDEGKGGFLGIGSRQARVRLTVSDQSLASARPESQGISEPPQPEAETSAPVQDEPAEAEESLDVEVVELSDEDRNILEIAQETVQELLEKMSIRAEVSATYGISDDPSRRPPVNVDIRGKDLSILIGRRAATLNALQFVARLIVSKELGRSILLVVDVEGYRERRERQLRRLARRMADQATKTGRRQSLEPMPANERRIVHMELREYPNVSTESVGEEPRRKVTILPEE